MAKKIIIISASVLVFIALTLLIYFFRVPISSFFTSSKYISSEEGQELYNKGLAEGSKNEEELNEKLDYYLSLMNNFPKLEKELSEKNIEIENLNDVINGKEIEISQLKSNLLDCENEILLLENKSVLDSQKIAQLESEAIALRSVITQKEQELLNVKTQKTELLATISYYENFIAQLETDTQTIASFEYNGSIISIQILNKGSYASIVLPSDTDYVKFNYWTVDGVKVDLSTYVVNSSTKFVANLTKYYDVKFIIDGDIVSSEIIQEGSAISLPSDPTKENYYFVGWSVNGVDVVDVTSYDLSSNVEFVALFKEYEWEVSFISQESVLSNQLVSNNEYAIPVYVSDTKFVKFKGWSLDNVNIVDVSTYPITSDCVFYAMFDYYYEINFYVDNKIIDSQIVLEGSLVKNVDPGVSDDPYQVFVCWSTSDGQVISLFDPIVNHLDLYAVFETSSGMYYETDDGSIAYMSWSELELNGYIDIVTHTDVGSRFYTLAPFQNLVGKFVIDESVTYLLAESFEYATNITDMVIPNSINLINNPDFTGSYLINLKSLVIPDNFPGYMPDTYNTLSIRCPSLDKVWLPSNSNFKLLSVMGKNHLKIFTNADSRKSEWAENFNTLFADNANGYFDVVYGATLDDYYNYSYQGYELLSSEIEVSFNGYDFIDLSEYVTLGDIENDLDYLEINIKSLVASGNHLSYSSYLNISNLKVGPGESSVFVDFIVTLSNGEEITVKDGIQFYFKVSMGKVYLLVGFSDSEYKISELLTETFVIDSILFYD